ncbi:hypothetical protein [Halovivax sp.]|uniref:hypothetical protein n=1 Tax=Halovivax sp. TaxID=1935978 RepID=UPI0025C1853B|nr:hypothetical protein [Halovivax sp.]
MGLLETLRGEGTGADDVCKFSREHYEVVYTVSTDTHEIAHAIAVGEAELDALADLLRADGEAEDREGSLSAALEAALDGDEADPDAVFERMRRPRRVTEAVVETWEGLLADDPDVVYLPIGMAPDLAAFVAVCRERADGDDAFDLPDSFEAVASLLVRIKEATDRPENRVVVHRNRLPTLEA